MSASHSKLEDMGREKESTENKIEGRGVDPDSRGLDKLQRLRVW